MSRPIKSIGSLDKRRVWLLREWQHKTRNRIVASRGGLTQCLLKLKVR